MEGKLVSYEPPKTKMSTWCPSLINTYCRIIVTPGAPWPKKEFPKTGAPHHPCCSKMMEAIIVIIFVWKFIYVYKYMYTKRAQGSNKQVRKAMLVRKAREREGAEWVMMRWWSWALCKRAQEEWWLKGRPIPCASLIIIISSRTHEFGLNTERLALGTHKLKLAIAAFRIEQAALASSVPGPNATDSIAHPALYVHIHAHFR